MIAYLILGLCLLVSFVLLLNWYANARPAQIWRTAKWSLALIGTILLLFLLISGRLAQALFALPLYLPVLMSLFRRIGMYRRAGSLGGGGGQASTGQTSTVETDWLAMELDHDSGAMSGQVKQGRLAGQSLGDLTLDDLISLMREIEQEDEESGDLLEAYLDRHHPDWRETDDTDQNSRRSSDRSRGARSVMTEAEALEILGLARGATADEIRYAHKQQMKTAHPDRGGSNELASKINEAKDFLLSGL
ncbi:molecular chaperone DnaJ [Alphaproteobacteria bacterium HT1-32]|nr:molecular chaperone DnaJ [Alphaproteobacteria bacterium HT1-32]